MTTEVFAFDRARRTNAQAIVDCVTLGYLAADHVVADVTYGLGRWWRDWRPDTLLATDLNPSKSPDTPADFRDLPYEQASIDVVCFDPPYKLNGTGGTGAGDEEYGVADAYVPVADRHTLIRDGITEAARVLKRRGVLLLKCQDQVAGEVHWQTREFAAHAEHVGFKHVDELYVHGSRKQPDGKTQRRFRRNYSTLLVLRLDNPHRGHPTLFAATTPDPESGVIDASLALYEATLQLAPGVGITEQRYHEAQAAWGDAIRTYLAEQDR